MGRGAPGKTVNQYFFSEGRRKGGKTESGLIDLKDILGQVFKQCLSFHCNISVSHCLKISSDQRVNNSKKS